MRDSLITQVSADTKTALEANADTMLGIIETMKIAQKGVSDSVKDFTKNLNEIFKKSKTILDNRAKLYHSTMERLFKIDGWRQILFWVGLFASILTPIILILNHFI